MEQGYAGCFKGVGGVFFFSSGVVSGIVQYTIFCFVLLDDHCIIIILLLLLLFLYRTIIYHHTQLYAINRIGKKKQEQ